MARPNIDLGGKVVDPYKKRTKLPEEILQELGDLDLGIDLGSDFSNITTDTSEFKQATFEGITRPSDFLNAYSFDKSIEAGINPNLQTPPSIEAGAITATHSIQLAQSIDTTDPKASVEEVASVTDVNAITRAERDAGFAAGKSLTPVDPGDTQEVDRPWFDQKPFDQQMDNLLKPAIVEDESKVPTKAFDYGPQVTGDPFDPLNIPPDRLPTIPGVGVDSTVPAAGEDNLLNAINNTGRFAPGQEQPKTAEDAMGILSNIHGPPSDRIFDVRDTTAVRAITGIISGLGKSAFGPSILNDPAKLAQNFGVGLAQKIVAGGDGGISLNPFTVKANLEGIKNNWERMGFINKAAAATYVGKLGAGIGNLIDEGRSTEKFGNIVGDHLEKVTGQLNLLGEGVGELVGDPENVLKGLNNILHRGSIGGTSTDLGLLHGRVSHSFDEKGKATTPGWVSAIMGFTPLSTGIKLARGATGKLLGGDDAHSQEAWSQVNAAMVGGARVYTSRGGENETDTKVYSNGKTAYTNLHTRVLGDKSYDLLANTTRLPEGAIIGNLTTSEIDLMFPGTNPFTGAENAAYRTQDINKQLLDTYKGLGGKSRNPTKEEYDALVQEKINPHIRGYNQALNMAAGRDIVKNMYESDSRNIELSKNEFRANELEAQTRGQKAPEIVYHSKQLGTLDDKPKPAPLPVFRPPQRQPVYDDPITDHPGSTADTPVGDTDWYV